MQASVTSAKAGPQKPNEISATSPSAKAGQPRFEPLHMATFVGALATALKMPDSQRYMSVLHGSVAENNGANAANPPILGKTR